MHSIHNIHQSQDLEMEFIKSALYLTRNIILIININLLHYEFHPAGSKIIVK